MNEVIAGSASGLLFSSLLITVGSFILFFLYRNGQPSVSKYFTGTTSRKVTLTIILVLNPLCAVTGVLFGMVFLVLSQRFPEYNVVANNGIYLGIILSLSFVLFAQTLLFSKTLWKYYLSIAVFFALIFGILIPLLLST